MGLRLDLVALKEGYMQKVEACGWKSFRVKAAGVAVYKDISYL